MSEALQIPCPREELRQVSGMSTYILDKYIGIPLLSLHSHLLHNTVHVAAAHNTRVCVNTYLSRVINSSYA